MAQFWTNPGVDSHTSAESLDRIAVGQAGIVKALGYGYAQPGDVPDNLPGEWKARWIDKWGMGNHGVLILIPMNTRTEALAVKGWTARLTELGLPEEEAAKIIVALRQEGRHPYEVFSPYSGYRDRRMYGDAWEEVLEVHKDAEGIFQHLHGRCTCWEEENEGYEETENADAE